MVYSSDFYTTRRPYSTYSTSRPYVSSYNVTRETFVPWDKVPLVPRPSLVPEPFTVWGRKHQDPKKEFYQFTTLHDKEGEVRGKNTAKNDHSRQLIESGAISKVGLDATGELAKRGHVFEHGILSRKPGQQRHATAPATGRTKILMALQTPSWYRF
ncbi:PREDICTED: uncharacterized protein LOC105360948 isoform X1 [Ceratosolen solmsi marchali]|uniref:Uncharacterized protein LOC105360948 isoform X1 n=1 Tax=Ceratosolen solmsi marchali TaxID=326594 RepID=A0AAJ7DTT2_9HYME|nr:PREDICTED: uncharacterized protein LOC105360948 isoform X1 [Ceratosolen solmsi marchali]